MKKKPKKKKSKKGRQKKQRPKNGEMQESQPELLKQLREFLLSTNRMIIYSSLLNFLIGDNIHLLSLPAFTIQSPSTAALSMSSKKQRTPHRPKDKTKKTCDSSTTFASSKPSARKQIMEHVVSVDEVQ